MTTLMQASHQWASRPEDQRYTSLLDMLARMEYVREHSRNAVVSSRVLECHPEGTDHKGIVVTGPNGHAYAPTHWSFGQLATLAEAPAGYLIPADTVKAALKANGRMPLLLSALPDGRYTLGSQVFGGLAGKYPDWRRVIPRRNTLALATEPGQFQPGLLQRAQDALADYDGIKGKRETHGVLIQYASTDTNGKSITATVGQMFGASSNACVVLMPYRMKAGVCTSFSEPAPYRAAASRA